MDWLSIVIAILVFVVPALLERDKKKKQRERWKKTDLQGLSRHRLRGVHRRDLFAYSGIPLLTH